MSDVETRIGDLATIVKDHTSGWDFFLNPAAETKPQAPAVEINVAPATLDLYIQGQTPLMRQGVSIIGYNKGYKDLLEAFADIQADLPAEGFVTQQRISGAAVEDPSINTLELLVTFTSE